MLKSKPQKEISNSKVQFLKISIKKLTDDFQEVFDPEGELTAEDYERINVLLSLFQNTIQGIYAKKRYASMLKQEVARVRVFEEMCHRMLRDDLESQEKAKLRASFQQQIQRFV